MTDQHLMPPRENISTKKDQIIHLIANGESSDILNDEDLGEDFNELMKYELIDINEDKVFLTALGEEARIVGVKNVIQKAKVNSIVKDIPIKVSRRKSKTLIGASLILFIILIVALMFLLR